MNPKLGNKQNDIRDDIGETRVVVETVAASLAAEQVDKDLKSRSTCESFALVIIHVAIVVVSDVAKQSSLSCSCSL